MPSKRQEKAKKRKAYIYQIWKESKQRYGAPKIQKMLQFQGINISLKCVRRYMKELGIRSLIVKTFRYHSEKITDTKKENLLKQDFTTTTIHQKWCTDITYIYTKKEGWTYLASVMDLHSRKILGYAYEKTMTAELAIKAVQNACLHVKNPKGIVLHSDLGVQYTSHMFEVYLKQKKELSILLAEKEIHTIMLVSNRSIPF